MKIRVIAGLSLAPVLLIVVLALPEIWTSVAVSFFAGIGVYELLWRTGLVKRPRMVVYSVIMGAAIPFWSFFGMPYEWGLGAVLLLFILLFAELLMDHGKIPFVEVSYCFFGGLIVPFLFSSLVRILGGENGRYYIMIPFFMAFLSDIGAYFTGRFFGKHKMAPIISPKKTIEGMIGGFVLDVLGMIGYAFILSHFFTLNVNYLLAALYGFVGAAAAVFGDLCFSVIKRQTGIKDYGNLIPGHGGVLDRFDSVIVVAPLAELLLRLIPLVV